MTSSLQISVTVFILIKDQGIVQMKLKQLLQHKSKSPEVDKGNESNHDKNETI